MTAEPSDQDRPEEGSTRDDQANLVRKQSFEIDGIAELELTVAAGRVEVRLADEPGVHVEISHDPGAGAPWAAGLNNLMNWVSDQVGQFGGPWNSGGWAAAGADSPRGFGWHGLGAEPSEAVRQCRLEQRGKRVVLRGPDLSALKVVPLAVTVHAPAGSSITVHSGAAGVTVSGQAAEVTVESGTGDVTLDGASGVVRARTGSGTIRLGPMLAGMRARSGSGDIDVSSVGESSNVFTASGNVRLGVVQADVVARTGAGDLRVDEAAAGQLELVTGSGEIRVGVRSGVTASIDLVSHSGQARSDLPVSENPPAGEHGSLTIRGRTGSGTATVTTA